MLIAEVCMRIPSHPVLHTDIFSIAFYSLGFIILHGEDNGHPVARQHLPIPFTV